MRPHREALRIGIGALAVLLAAAGFWLLAGRESGGGPEDRGARSADAVTADDASSVESRPAARTLDATPFRASEEESVPAGAAPAGPVDVTGRVLDPAGAPVPYADVTLRRDGTRERYTTSAADGTFALRALARETWSLTVAATDRPAWFRDVDLAGDDAAATFEIRLGGSRFLPVAFVCDGEPLVKVLRELGFPRSSLGSLSAAVVVRVPGDGGAAADAFRPVPSAGRYRPREAAAASSSPLEESADGIFQVDAPPPLELAAVFDKAILATCPYAGAEDRIRFEVPRAAIERALCTVEGRFVDEVRSVPLAGATVRAHGGASAVATRTQPDGTFRLLLVPGREVLLSCRGPGLECWRQPLVPRCGERTDVGRIGLREPCELKAAVSRVGRSPTEEELAAAIERAGEDSEAAADIMTSWANVPRLWALEADFVGSAAAEAELLAGSLAFDAGERSEFRLSERRHWIVAVQREAAPAAALVDPRRHAANELALALRPGIEASLDRAPCFDRGTLRVIRADGAPMYLDQSLPRSEPLRLEPGRYLVEVRRDGATTFSKSIEVGTAPLTITTDP